MELVFECYGAPRVLPVIPSFIDNFSNQIQLTADFSKHPIGTGINIHLGYTTTTITVFVDGVPRSDLTRRLNLGTKNIYDYLCTLMTIQYPTLIKRLNHDKLSYIFNSHIFCARNYDEQLRYLDRGLLAFKTFGYSHPEIHKRNKYVLEYGESYLREPVLLELFPKESSDQVSPEEMERRARIREELHLRIREANRKKNEEKRLAKENDLHHFQKILAELDSLEDDEEEIKEILMENDFESILDIRRAIKKLRINLGLVSKEELEKERLSLINVPDSELDDKQRRKKRFQMMHLENAKKKEAKRLLREKEKENIIKVKEENPDQYLSHLYEKRNRLLSKIKKLAHNKPTNKLASQRRMMEIIDSYCSATTDQAEADLLLECDEEEDKEKYQQKLQEVETEIRELDPKFIEELEKNMLFYIKDGNTIEFTTEAIRTVEILFKPYLVGTEQMGIGEIIEDLISVAGHKIGLDISLSGGGAQIVGLAERIQEEVSSIINSEIGQVKVHKPDEVKMSAWRGMRDFYNAASTKDKQDLWVTKKEFEESGRIWAKQNNCYSNVFE